MESPDPRRMVLVDATNVDQTSFFCLQSKPQSPGYVAKRHWLEARFAEGLRIRMLGAREGNRWVGERGFVETIPGEHAWRAIEAPGTLVIHCLWVVGKSRGKGGARDLMAAVLADARADGYAGVVTVTAENGFATGRRFYERFGFEAVATCQPNMALMLHRFDDSAPPPTFSAGALRGAAAYPQGLTVLRTDQCPYIEGATQTLLAEAERHGLGPAQVIELDSAATVREHSPTPYGVFAAVLNGHLLSYRYLSPREFASALRRVNG